MRQITSFLGCLAVVLLGTLWVQSVQAADCVEVDKAWLTSDQTDLGEMVTDNDAVWMYDATWKYAKGKSPASSGNWLMTPALDLRGSQSVALTFAHTHKWCTSPTEELSLWVCANYTGDPSSATWSQLTINPYAANTDWIFVDVEINVPVSKVGEKTVFGFKLQGSGTWEIKNIALSTTCPSGGQGGGGGITPDPTPTGNQLRVCGQNLLNYYLNYNESSRPKYHTEAGFKAKTQKIVKGLVGINADIYALCEVEGIEAIVTLLADSMSAYVGVPGRYVAVNDGINNENDSWDNNLKSCFIYRADRVKPVGPNMAASTAAYYQYVQRIQAFELLSNGERLVVNMNHFKAREDGDSDDQSREMSAKSVVNSLKGISSDPDRLLLGDYNTLYGESPITLIEQGGYEEQLLRFDSSEYSYCFKGEPQLIDHVFANASMAQQITNAYVKHLCSYECSSEASSATSYSDHDACIVELKLGKDIDLCNVGGSYLATGGTDWDLGEMSQVNMAGQYYWRYQSKYGATCQDAGGDNWLLTPTYNFSESKYVEVVFDHAINYGNANKLKDQCQLMVTPEFSTVDASQWYQLTIPTYPEGTSWTFIEKVKVVVPLEYVGQHTAFGFHYKVPSGQDKTPTWEIKNLSVLGSCDPSMGIEETKHDAQRAIRFIENGQLFIMLPDNSVWTVTGTRVK